ncbi:3-dehydroquinate synthase [Candidatus Peregrinibacteria bacterium]|jgi:3-dehydroquinate synthase|nr:3-dehydroquinate synthase [Candidatus Peregrinibacteria bacterium]MBT4055830.1 3-dehydroquinate synthase [Candidatus Peregrinibacteria bacterium]
MKNPTIKKGISLEIPKKLKSLKLGESYAIITDSKVKKLYGGKLLWNLKKAGLNAEIFSFPYGEKSKNLQTVENLENQMIEKGFDRSSCIIALGGGVVGDIAGFVASTFMRGIPYVQVPTTLLAMVDSSIGGKTGVNLKHGKNLIGTFHQPSHIFTDPIFLKTLSTKHLRNGLAECIKHGIIQSKPLFNFIDKNIEKILKLDPQTIVKLIKDASKIKTIIVKKDKKEKGLRQILNYGHTFGHAVEKQSNYTLLHGFAISIGMILANQESVRQGLLSQEDASCIKKLLKKAGLPVYTMHKPTLKDLSKDKKKHSNHVNLILPTKIGEVKICPQKV